MPDAQQGLGNLEKRMGNSEGRLRILEKKIYLVRVRIIVKNFLKVLIMIV